MTSIERRLIALESVVGIAMGNSHATAEQKRRAIRDVVRQAVLDDIADSDDRTAWLASYDAGTDWDIDPGGYAPSIQDIIQEAIRSGAADLFLAAFNRRCEALEAALKTRSTN